MRCGLLGRKLGHSYSPQIHRQLADYDYKLYEIEPEALEDFLQKEEFSGLNVTIPYKKAVIPFCSQLTDRAKKLGAVNTIVRRKDGGLIGHNTDYYGFEAIVKRSGLRLEGKKVLVLGSGGASATAVAVLTDLGSQPVIISRNGADNYTNIDRHYDAAAIVNATPVGMYPNTDEAPLDLTPFTKLQGVLDLIYNPANTALLQQAQQRNLVAENGLYMLVAQAKESAQWFTGTPISDEIIPVIHKQLSSQMQNIILIGMPGSGKSTVGARLAERLGRSFVDADAEIVKTAGRSIPDIFAQTGEAGFRAIESSVLSKLGKQSGLVIATGGGCVTKAENYKYLHQNGIIIWLQREIDSLPTEGRPLSQSGNLHQMYQKRKALYEAFSDIAVSNNQPADDTVQAIISHISKED